MQWSYPAPPPPRLQLQLLISKRVILTQTAENFGQEGAERGRAAAVAVRAAASTGNTDSARPRHRRITFACFLPFCLFVCCLVGFGVFFPALYTQTRLLQPRRRPTNERVSRRQRGWVPARSPPLPPGQRRARPGRPRETWLR